MWVEKLSSKDKVLIEACKYIADYTDSCPLNSMDHDMDCENRCSANMENWICWCNFFKEKAEEHIK